MLFIFPAQSAVNEDEPADQQIRRLIERASEQDRAIFVGNIALISRKALPEFYLKRNFNPAWTKKRDIQEFIEILEAGYDEGLNPEDYHLSGIISYQGIKRKNEVEKAELDLLLTDAFLSYTSHMLVGKVDPQSIQAEWQIHRREADLVEVLHKALSTGKIAEHIDELRPNWWVYNGLKDYLKSYREIEKKGGWTAIPEGETLKKDQQDERVSLLKERLIWTGELKSEDIGNDMFFDEKLEQAVITFQKRHGLPADGSVGKMTLELLNIPVSERIKTIVLNMERARWLPVDFGPYYLITNIASFELFIVENGARVMQMDVIVGKDYRKTPVFSSTMTYLVVNPTWTVPPTILRNDVIPAIKKDPGYLQKNRMRLYEGFGSKETEVDPSTIDWPNVQANRFPYTVRQDAGPGNALGAFKFMFPNSHNVYLHDTNRRDLFSRSERALSSGCIRVAEPLELATFLLRDSKAWNKKKLEDLVQSGKTQTIFLPKPIAVYLLYGTAYVDRDGLLQFRKDIYDRDMALWQALNNSFTVN